jgi:hypothetical protein
MWPGGADPFGGWYLGSFWEVSQEIFKLHTDYKMVAWQMHPLEKMRRDEFLGEDLDGWKGQGYRTSDTNDLAEITVDIPPIGEPDGPRSPYELYAEHQRRRLSAVPEEWGADEAFWKQRFWYYNWHLPWIPVYRTANQVWYNTENWDYSRAQNHFMWDYWGDTWKMADLIADGFMNAQT